ncbi:glycosyltransferase family 2 protein [Eubacterium barkeri]|uniref:Glycosyltransferase, GT2 family n=1 Tax=Eubacterium barkeri TaxID=1528 RepID=A0A1H3CHC7_EUBBA|nr:glycosyltransferase family 2 protein [Eubacterium barkeri]SDX52889.1 Glycosyltransferase, GT2 family [Eubacterium barkeri]
MNNMEKIRKIFIASKICARKVKRYSNRKKKEWSLRKIYRDQSCCKIKFSIVMPVYNVEIKWLSKAIESVQRQIYPNWELCIVNDCSTKEGVAEFLETIMSDRIKIRNLDKNVGISEASNIAASMADGDYILLMDNDDEITIDALYEFKKAVDQDNPDIIYSDQDMIDIMGHRSNPLCKPDWSYDLLLSQMYMGHLVGLKRTLFEKVEGFKSEYNGSQDYDLILRSIEETTNIYHIPKILYSWRALPTSTSVNPNAKPYSQISGKQAVQDHLNRKYGIGKARVNELDRFFMYDVEYEIEGYPQVAIVIPMRDQTEMTRNCIKSIIEKTTYKNYEILLINNRSEEKTTAQYLFELQESSLPVKVIDANIPFNWSKLNNIGIKNSQADVFVFLNNDTEVIEGRWLERMVAKVTQDGVGVVGGLLLYEDRTIQHAGVVVGMNGWADHVYKGAPIEHTGTPFISPLLVRNVSSVTGACMAISRRTIEKIGLFNERFLICGSDVELCLRALGMGLRNIVDPMVRLYHFESKSRDASNVPNSDFKLSDHFYGKMRTEGDPFFNEQLDSFCMIPTRRKNC